MNEEQREKDIPNSRKKRSRWLELDSRRQLVYFAVGAYLVYLAIKILTGLSGEAAAARVFPIIAAIFFIIVGGALAVCCVMSHIMQLKEPQKNSADENDEEKE